MNFDDVYDRHGKGTAKWDGMHLVTGVSAPDAIPMWIADMDFEPPVFLQDTVQALRDNAAYGYFVGQSDYHRAVSWWMKERHGWDVDPHHVFSTHGIGNAVALCLQAFTQPGDGVIVFTPVYHEFGVRIRNGGREVVESPLAIRDGVYCMDLAALEAQLTGREKAVLFCSPHNPAGRVWSVDEQKELAAFCARHDLILMSDEIHQDLVHPGFTHFPMAAAAPEALDRIVTLTAASKTFNIAGTRIGNVIIPNPDLRQRFGQIMEILDIKPNLFGLRMAQAVYSPEGAAWAEALAVYIAENARVFADGAARIPGVVPMPMQATYLAWLDFANTGMEMDEVARRVKEDARIAPIIGANLGEGGASYLRFNIGTARARVEEAVLRLQDAFSDLQ